MHVSHGLVALLVLLASPAHARVNDAAGPAAAGGGEDSDERLIIH